MCHALELSRAFYNVKLNIKVPSMILDIDMEDALEDRIPE